MPTAGERAKELAAKGTDWIIDTVNVKLRIYNRPLFLALIIGVLTHIGVLVLLVQQVTLCSIQTQNFPCLFAAQNFLRDGGYKCVISIGAEFFMVPHIWGETDLPRDLRPSIMSCHPPDWLPMCHRGDPYYTPCLRCPWYKDAMWELKGADSFQFPHESGCSGPRNSSETYRDRYIEGNCPVAPYSTSPAFVEKFVEVTNIYRLDDEKNLNTFPCAENGNPEENRFGDTLAKIGGEMMHGGRRRGDVSMQMYYRLPYTVSYQTCTPFSTALGVALGYASIFELAATVVVLYVFQKWGNISKVRPGGWHDVIRSEVREVAAIAKDELEGQVVGAVNEHAC